MISGSSFNQNNHLSDNNQPEWFEAINEAFDNNHFQMLDDLVPDALLQKDKYGRSAFLYLLFLNLKNSTSIEAQADAAVKVKLSRIPEIFNLLSGKLQKLQPELGSEILSCSKESDLCLLRQAIRCSEKIFYDVLSLLEIPEYKAALKENLNNITNGDEVPHVLHAAIWSGSENMYNFVMLHLENNSVSKFDFYYMLGNAILSGSESMYNSVMVYLEKPENHEKLKHNLLRLTKNNLQVLEQALQSGSEVMFSRLMRHIEKPQNIQISKEELLAVVRFVVENGFLNIFNALLKIEVVKEIAADNNHELLCAAAASGCVQMVEFFLDNGSEINVDTKGTALKDAAMKGCFAVIAVLLNRCGTDINPNDKAEAIVKAAENGHLEALNALLADESVLQQATYQGNAALTEAQTRANADENDRLRYQPIVERLLQIPAVRQLAQQQANQELNLAHIGQFAENSMQQVTMNEAALINHLKLHYQEILSSENWETIRAQMLDYLSIEYLKSPARDGFSRARMLAEGATFPVAFPADTILLQIKGQNCIAHWFDGKDFQLKQLPLESITKAYELLSKESLLNQESQDLVLLERIMECFEISHPAQNQPLPLVYQDNLSPSQLLAYYRHPVHGAWRYLSERNPWLSQEAQFVEVFADNQRAAIISEEDKELIGYYWTAICDKEASLEKNFSVDGNKAVFASVLAEINRGHNCDERPVHPATPHIKTTADDLLPDKPSCSFGVKKRLLQSEYGHPHINCPQARELTPAVMLDRIASELITHKDSNNEQPDLLFDSLDKCSILLLKSIQQDLSDALELYDYEETDKIMLTPEQLAQKEAALLICEEVIGDFIRKSQIWYGEDRIQERHQVAFALNAYSKSGPLAVLQKSYAAMIEYCTHQSNLIGVFSGKLTEYLNQRIKELECLASIDVEHHQNTNTFLISHPTKRKRATEIEKLNLWYWDKRNDDDQDEQPQKKVRF